MDIFWITCTNAIHLSCVFFWMWGIIILLAPTRGLRLAYAATVGAYAGTSCRKFAYAAYASVVLLRRCLRGYSPGTFFPTCQVMAVRFYVNCLLLRLLFLLFFSSSSPTAMMWAQCSLPDLNRDLCRTSTAIMWVQCSFQVGDEEDASCRGNVYWKASWGERDLRGYNQIRLHLAYGYAYAKNRLRVESPIFWKKLGLSFNKTYQAYAPETLKLGLWTLHLWQVTSRIRLRLAYDHIILYMCLRPPTPPREMPTSTMINVNLLINLYVYKKNSAHLRLSAGEKECTST